MPEQQVYLLVRRVKLDFVKSTWLLFLIVNLDKITVVITRFFVIYIATLMELFSNFPLFYNCPLLKDISFNTNCLLLWCDSPTTTWLVWTIFVINHPCNFWKLWSCPSKKMLSGILSQITLPNWWLLVLKLLKVAWHVCNFGKTHSQTNITCSYRL